MGEVGSQLHGRLHKKGRGPEVISGPLVIDCRRTPNLEKIWGPLWGEVTNESLFPSISKSQFPPLIRGNNNHFLATWL